MNWVTTRWFVILCLLTTNFSLAQTSQIDSLQALLKKLPQDTNRVNVLVSLCVQEQSFQADSLLRPAQELLALSQKLNVKHREALACNFLAQAYHKKGKILKAAEYLLQASGLYKDLKDTFAVASMYNNIGILYASGGEEKRSLEYFKLSIDLSRIIGQRDVIMTAMHNLADAYAQLDMDSAALVNHEAALKLADETGDISMKVSILRGIGAVYYKQGRYEEALAIQQRALLLEPASAPSSSKYDITISMAKIYLALKLPAQALASANTALEAARLYGDKFSIAACYDQLSQAHALLKDFENAYTFYTLYAGIRDSLKSADNLIAIEKLNYAHELEKKESEITILNQRHQAQTFQRNAFITALIVLIIIGILLYNRYRLLTNRRLELKKRELDFYIKRLLEKSETIIRINAELEAFKGKLSEDDVQAEKLDKILQTNILTEDDWENFKKAFEEIYPVFFSRLRYRYPGLTTAELRLSALIKLNLSLKEVATILGISWESVKTARYRLKKKYKLGEDETLEEFIDKLTSKEGISKKLTDQSVKIDH